MRPEGVLLLGDSRCAWRVAELLTAAGVSVAISAPDPGLSPPPGFRAAPAAAPLEALPGTRLRSCRGAAGDFEIRLTRGTERLVRRVQAVVVACREETLPLVPDPGLAALPALQGLSRFRTDAFPPQPEGAPLPVVVFLDGLVREGRPDLSGRVMGFALELESRRSAHAIILCGNLKVAGEGLEALAHRARSAGVRFFKFERTRPAFRPLPDGRIEIRFTDPATGEPFGLAADVVVAEEAACPPAAAEEIATVLGLERDPGGFLQSENVHRLPVFTNRRGVVVAGPGRLAGSDPELEAANAALAVLESLGREVDPQAAAAIEPGRCIRCLTCLRLCPYRAIALEGERPRVLPPACERCGVCAAECPREAIRLEGLDRPGLSRLLDPPPETAPAGAPRITVFACSRSAAPALREARAAGLPLPAALRVVELPCAGALAPEVIRTAFSRGADGVLVLTCHEGNCHSRHGNLLAGRRAEETRAFLERAGLGGGRIAWGTLAANMPHEAAAAIARLAEALGKATTRKEA